MPQELRRLRLPPRPTNHLGPGTIADPTRSARGGHQSSEHPVHVRVAWDTGEVEEVWGLLTEWNDDAMRVHLFRHGEAWLWFARADVRPCRATVLHEPAWWPPEEGPAHC